MNISKHVTRAEFEHSNVAINYGIPNSMDSTQLASAILLCEKVFEPLRAQFGVPIKINSGFRSLAVNKRLGGSSKTSQHMKGEALDLHIGSKEFHWIKENLDFDQLIWEMGNANEPQWVHVSYKKAGNRKQVLRATKKADKTVYSPF